jgi:hypothetical protein
VLAAGLQLPHIVEIGKVGAWQAQQHLVMDCVEGLSLVELVTNPGSARPAACE